MLNTEKYTGQCQLELQVVSSTAVGWRVGGLAGWPGGPPQWVGFGRLVGGVEVWSEKTSIFSLPFPSLSLPHSVPLNPPRWVDANPLQPFNLQSVASDKVKLIFYVVC